MAVYNGESFLLSALDSVLRQSLTDLELIVVDDGSQDRTAEILAAIDDPRLAVVHNDEQQGLAASLNRGLDAARGRYVGRLDADDVAFPRWLERQVARMRSDGPVGVVGSGAMEMTEEGLPGVVHSMPVGNAAVRWAALFSSPFYHSALLLDAQLFRAHGLQYDGKYLESEDYDLWTRLLTIADGDNLPEPLFLYRMHAAQASRSRRTLQRSFQLEIALREIGRVAPELSPRDAELAFRVGTGEQLGTASVEEATSAYLELLRAFECRHPRERAVRSAASRALVRTALHTGGASRVRVMRRALGLEKAVLVNGAVSRAARRVRARKARSEVRPFLRTLRAAVGPIRVTAVFPEPTPYRAPLLDRVAMAPGVDLTVIYAAETVAGRTWDVEPRHPALYLRGMRVPGAARILHHDYPVTPGLARKLGRARPDVVVVSGWSTFAAQAAIAWCQLRSVPYVLVVESHDEGPRAGWRRTVKGTVVPSIVRGASGVLVTGTLARRSMIERGASPDRVGVFANTIDVDAFGERADRLAARRPELRAELGAGPEDVVVLSVARLASEKGLDVLVRAVAEVGDPRLVLVVAGGGPEEDELETLGRDLGVRLVLTGDLPWERIAETYVVADVFALLSERESWAVVVNEAAACGLPLVLSDRVGAAYDLLRDGENGVLVAAGDVAATARALRRLAADPLVRLAYSASSRSIAANWGYGPSVTAFLAAVREAVPARPGALA